MNDPSSNNVERDSGVQSTGFFSLSGGRPTSAVCTWSRQDDDTWTVAIEAADFAASARASDAFEGLNEVRRRWEPEDWRFGLAGVRENVWPSGMARSTGGTRAYVLDPERLAAHDFLELVDVFEPVPPESVVDLSTQLEYVRRYLGEKVR